MLINLTISAVSRLKHIQSNVCCIVVKKGGCYGYNASFTLEQGDTLSHLQDGIAIYYSGPNIESETLVVDYKESLVRSGFVVEAVHTSNCCCNRSFGRKLDKKQCL